MNGIVLLLAKTIRDSLRQTPSARQSAFAVTAIFCLSATSFGQEKETPNADAWNHIFAALRHPRDTVVRAEGKQDELPLSLTSDEIRNPSNGILRVERFETKLLGEIDKANQTESEANWVQAEKALAAMNDEGRNTQ